MFAPDDEPDLYELPSWDLPGRTARYLRRKRRAGEIRHQGAENQGSSAGPPGSGHWKRLESICRILLLLSGSFALLAIGGGVLWLYPTARRIDSASAALLTCNWRDQAGKWRGNGACLQSEILAITGSTRAAAGAIAAGMPKLVRSAETTTRNAAAESRQIVAVTEALRPVIARAGRAVGSADDTLVSLDDLVRNTDHRLNGPEGTLPTLNAQIPKLGAIADGFTAPEGILPGARTAIDRAIQLMADPNIPATMASLAEASRSGAAAMAHVDHASGEVDETLKFIRDDFSPKHVGFWQHLLDSALSELPSGLVNFFLQWHPQRVTTTNPQ